jgi:hypothetical protein
MQLRISLRLKARLGFVAFHGFVLGHVPALQTLSEQAG